jgi:hypothetical protein
MAFTVIDDPATIYRGPLTVADTADIATLTTAVFTRASNPIPVVPVVGRPNVYVRAATTNTADSIGVTPVALRRDQFAGYTIVAVGSELTLTSGAFSDGTLFLSPAAVFDAMGARGSQLMGGGAVTHVAFLVTTAPTAARAVTLYAWASA